MPNPDPRRSTVLITGAGGFVGSMLCRKLGTESYDVRAVVRNKTKEFSQTLGVTYIESDLLTERSLADLCSGVDCVVHLAGRAHVLREKKVDPLDAFRQVNSELTLRLARQAALSGVRRFIFISSIGVNGNKTEERPFDESSQSNPEAYYAVSKFEAEQRLIELAAATGMELVIVRPPLIFGVDAPGNFGRLLKVVASNLPLPFSNINNLRSLVSVQDVVSFIGLAIHHPSAAGELFLLSNGDDVSTTQIVRSLARGMGKKKFLFFLPSRLLEIGAAIVGRTGMYTQLFGSLQIDSSKARRTLGWRPAAKTCAELEEIGRLYVDRNSKA
ncbi:NAD-dependent epimerase/dehydratase family protein [Pseudomonas brassicacearum]|uniref:NAD-dependent epimerase/dehydratase family protein n=1 Tax=Pseudomonas brassicacearum TaxID=930166 RepID=UPI001296A9CB|nr:NAD-dependent epimerase/dehydratase family protein [Pseudomonas brassicacearum]QGA49116.1 NAD-dependent epimerase/dehydratase family protein [Pseudomonas brassicacearum]